MKNSRLFSCIGKRVLSAGMAVLLTVTVIPVDVYATTVDSEIEIGESEDTVIHKDAAGDKSAVEESTDGAVEESTGNAEDENTNSAGGSTDGNVDGNTDGSLNGDIDGSDPEHIHEFLDGFCECGMDEETWLLENDIPEDAELSVDRLSSAKIDAPGSEDEDYDTYYNKAVIHASRYIDEWTTDDIPNSDRYIEIHEGESVRFTASADGLLDSRVVFKVEAGTTAATRESGKSIAEAEVYKERVSNENYVLIAKKKADRYIRLALYYDGELYSYVPIYIIPAEAGKKYYTPPRPIIADTAPQTEEEIADLFSAAIRARSQASDLQYIAVPTGGIRSFDMNNIMYNRIYGMGSDQMDLEPDEGDYLAVEGYSATYIWPQTLHWGASTKYSYTYEGKTYYEWWVMQSMSTTTPEQEERVTAGIKELCTTGELARYRYSDRYTQVKACQEWVERHVSYSYNGNNWADPNREYWLSAASAYIDGASDCRGYALLLYRLLREFGIPTRILERIEGAQHIWNLVYMDDVDMWFSCDASAERGILLKGTNSYSIAGYAKLNDDYETNVISKVSRTDYQPPKAVNVYFDANGGTAEFPSKSIVTGKPYLTLPEATREGYTFLGWYTDKTAGELITSETMMRSQNNHTLYAHWLGNEYTVTFDAAGGTMNVRDSSKAYITYSPDGRTGTMKVNYDANYGYSKSYAGVRNFPVPTRTGYEFVAWSLDGAGENIVTSETIVKTGSNHTLTAIWRACEYSMSIMPLSADSSSATLTVTYDMNMSDLSEMIPVVVKRGYSFAGWYTEANGGIAIYTVDSDGTLIPNDGATEYITDGKWTYVGNVKLYAHWTPNLHEVTFSVPAYTGKNESGASISISAHEYTFNVLNNYSLEEMLADNKVSYEMNSALYGSDKNMQISGEDWTWERILGVADNSVLSSADWIYVSILPGIEEGESDGFYDNGTLFDVDTRITQDIKLTASWFAVSRLDAPVFGEIDSEAGYIGQVGSSSDVWTVVEGTRLIITAEPGTKIYYTTDGSAPNQFTNAYNRPISLKVRPDFDGMGEHPGITDEDIAEGVYGDLDESDADSDGVIKIQAVAVSENRQMSDIAKIEIHILDTESLGDIVGNYIDDKNDLYAEGYLDEYGVPYVPDGLWAHVVTYYEYNAQYNEDTDNPEHNPVGWGDNLVPATYSYTGSAIKPDVRVYYGNKLLTAGTDYTLTYRNNVNASNEFADESKQPYVTVKGRGKYSGKCTRYFVIDRQNINSESVFISDNTVVAATGRAQQPFFTVTDNGKKLVLNRDYKISVIGGTYASGGSIGMGSSCMEVGSYTCRVTGAGNYSGYVTRTFTITNDMPLDRASVSTIRAKEYDNGNEIVLSDKDIDSLIVRYNLKNYKVAASLADAMAKNADISNDADKYKLYIDSSTYSNNRNAGTASVKIKAIVPAFRPASGGVEVFYGEKTLTYKINPISLNGASITGVDTAYSYDGSEIKPAVSVMKAGVGIASTNYTVTYKNNVNAGTATITVKGKGNYNGTIKKTFKINELDIAGNIKVYNETHYPDNGGFADADKEALYWNDMTYAYTKGGNTPAPIVLYQKDGGIDEPLIQGVDYHISYSGNRGLTGATPATMTITGMGNYKGSMSISFNVVGADIENLVATASDVVYRFKAGAWKSAIVIREADGTALKAGVDYDSATLKYEYVNRAKLTSKVSRKPGELVAAKDIPPVGTIIKVSVRAKEGGNYDTKIGQGVGDEGCGTISTTYRIIKANLSSATVNVQTQTYKGTPVVPRKSDIKVRVGRTTLKATDYDILSVTGNTKKGYATMVIRGTGEYGGTKTVRFRIK